MSNRRQIILAADAYRFALGGNATFTTVSKATGNRFTYRVVKSDKPDLFFVSVLTGSDNESSYSYMGTISNTFWKHGAKSKISADAPSAKAFKWIWANLKGDRIPETCEIWHEARCCRCGRKLTVPASIESGWGPECVKFRAEAA